jgi:hypothetical protein
LNDELEIGGFYIYCLSRDEMLRAVGMLENGAIQRVVAEGLHTSHNVISRLWSRYRSTQGMWLNGTQVDLFTTE